MFEPKSEQSTTGDVTNVTIYGSTIHGHGTAGGEIVNSVNSEKTRPKTAISTLELRERTSTSKDDAIAPAKEDETP